MGDIRMMVTCNYIVIVVVIVATTEEDQGCVSNAPLNRKYDKHDIERQPSKDQRSKIKLT